MKRRLKILASALLIIGLAAGVSISYNDPSANDQGMYRDCPAYLTHPGIFNSLSDQNWERASRLAEAVAAKTGERSGTLAGSGISRNYIDDYTLADMAAAG